MPDISYFYRCCVKHSIAQRSVIYISIKEVFSDDESLWNDVLLTVCEEKPRDTLTSIVDESVKKKALELSRACYMFTSVLMRPSGVQYHIDLAQNILSTAMHNDALKNELYAQLIKLTSGSMPFGIQVCHFSSRN